MAVKNIVFDVGNVLVKWDPVSIIQKTYETGVRLCKAAMKNVEAKLLRRDGLEPWFVDILYTPTGVILLPGSP